MKPKNKPHKKGLLSLVDGKYVLVTEMKHDTEEQIRYVIDKEAKKKHKLIKDLIRAIIYIRREGSPKMGVPDRRMYLQECENFWNIIEKEKFWAHIIFLDSDKMVHPLRWLESVLDTIADIHPDINIRKEATSVMIFSKLLNQIPIGKYSDWYAGDTIGKMKRRIKRNTQDKTVLRCFELILKDHERRLNGPI